MAGHTPDIFFNLSVIIPCVALVVAVMIIRTGDVTVSYCKDLKVAVTTPTSAQAEQMPYVCV